MRSRLAPILAATVLVACGADARGPDNTTPRSQVDAAMPPAPGCGNRRCEGLDGETCATCPDDCGRCSPCDTAPACENALGVPASPKRRGDFDKPTPSASAPIEPSDVGCGPAQLRMRLKQLQTRNGGSEVYCLVNATDGVKSELAVTNKTRKMGKNDVFYFDPVREGVFWGQKALDATRNNLTVTYNCFRVVTDDLSKILKAAGDAAMMAGGVAGEYGWAFGLAGVAADVAAAALGANAGDSLDLNIQQTIPKTAYLDLTNGREWTITQGDWTITIQAWGCSDGVPR